jgi:response regulator RpfG family c-di-GMP phosphodiesterase
MNRKVLFVDDEPNVLASFSRNLGRLYQVDTATGGPEGLALIGKRGPYAVVVSDLRMPDMDGVQFLAKVREVAPDTVRMMLSGHADLEAAVAAVNEGNVFRFLTKPCPTQMLITALRDGIEQHRLITAEREFLRGTLRGSVKVLTEVLGLSNPEAFGRSERIKRLVRRVGKSLQLPDRWRLELAAMLSQLGCVTVPEETLRKAYAGEPLSPGERELFAAHPEVGSKLLSNIPNLEEVSQIVARQEEPFRPDSDLPLGSRMLKIALDYDTLASDGRPPGEAFAGMRARNGLYDPKLLDAFEQILCAEEGYVHRALPVRLLDERMLLDENIRTPKGLLVLGKGQELTGMSIQRIRNFAATHGIIEPVKVLAPIELIPQDQIF